MAKPRRSTVIWTPQLSRRLTTTSHQPRGIGTPGFRSTPSDASARRSPRPRPWHRLPLCSVATIQARADSSASAHRMPRPLSSASIPKKRQPRAESGTSTTRSRPTGGTDFHRAHDPGHQSAAIYPGLSTFIQKKRPPPDPVPPSESSRRSLETRPASPNRAADNQQPNRWHDLIALFVCAGHTADTAECHNSKR